MMQEPEVSQVIVGVSNRNEENDAREQGSQIILNSTRQLADCPRHLDIINIHPVRGGAGRHGADERYTVIRFESTAAIEAS